MTDPITERAAVSYIPHLPAFRIAEAKLRAAGLIPIADVLAERIRQTEAALAARLAP